MLCDWAENVDKKLEHSERARLRRA